MMAEAARSAQNEVQQWETFIETLQNDILPLYRKHEQTFDPMGTHGRMHICRSIILAECMAHLYSQFVNVDRFAIRYAVAFHDSGRQGNGVDIWERDSAQKCLKYLQRFSIDRERCEWISSLIVKDTGSLDINKQIANDADTLEILRLIDVERFKRDRLQFGQGIPQLAELREQLIEEALQLIDITEKVKYRLRDSCYVKDAVALARAYPLLASGLIVN